MPWTHPGGRLAAFLVLGALVVTPAGCSSDDDADSGGTSAVSAGKAEAAEASEIRSHIATSDVVRAFPPTVVKDGDIKAMQPGTPERALLEWWQAFQFHDAKTVTSLTGKATLGEIGRRQIAAIARSLSLPGIKILDVSTTGDTALVFAGLLTFSPQGPDKRVPKKPTDSKPATFTMTREGGEWGFDETEFLLPKLSALR